MRWTRCACRLQRGRSQGDRAGGEGISRPDLQVEGMTRDWSSPLPLPKSLQNRLALPAVAAPMFLCSGPDLVVESCRAGILGTFPALNQRTSEGYAAWLDEIAARL